MIDKDLIDELPEEKRGMVIQALKLFVESGILDLQRKRLLAQLAQGREDEDDEKLKTSIFWFRRRDHALHDLQLTGESYLQEN